MVRVAARGMGLPSTLPPTTSAETATLLAMRQSRAIGKEATYTSGYTYDEPASTSDVVKYAAEMLGIEPPAPQPFESAVMSSAAERYFLENRRISNALTKQSLGWRPQYPSYREGLAANLQNHFR
jgi:nucleoside-diphosphate-sugar epimerase